MAQAPLQYKNRFPDEICDYCHRHRVVITDFRLAKSRDPAGHEWGKLSASLRARCICGPTVPCRDKICGFYKKQRGTE